MVAAPHPGTRPGLRALTASRGTRGQVFGCFFRDWLKVALTPQLSPTHDLGPSTILLRLRAHRGPRSSLCWFAAGAPVALAVGFDPHIQDGPFLLPYGRGSKASRMENQPALAENNSLTLVNRLRGRDERNQECTRHLVFRGLGRVLVTNLTVNDIAGLSRQWGLDFAIVQDRDLGTCSLGRVRSSALGSVAAIFFAPAGLIQVDSCASHGYP